MAGLPVEVVRQGQRLEHPSQLRYKARQAGILVVTTEESYTSKTSFALNEPLKVKNADLPVSSGNSEPRTEEAAEVEQPVPAYLGRLHADLNGASNIVRKPCPKFNWHARLSAAYELLWLSPKTGLSPMKLKGPPADVNLRMSWRSFNFMRNYETSLFKVVGASCAGARAKHLYSEVNGHAHLLSTLIERSVQSKTLISRVPFEPVFFLVQGSDHLLASALR